MDSHQDLKLVINLDIGDDGSTGDAGEGGRDDYYSSAATTTTNTRFVIKDMTINLKNVMPKSDDHVIPMPGINGPHPNLSSGRRMLEVLNEGEFVTMDGVQHLQVSKPTWEMIWKKDSMAGCIICGFELSKDYKRNEASATLPKGRIYFSFPIWTQDTLSRAQYEKDIILRRAQDCLTQKDIAMKKLEEESNPIRKALYFREACLAVEKYDINIKPISLAKQIPTMDDVIPIIQNGNSCNVRGSNSNNVPPLFLTKNGLIWSKVLPQGEQILLGTANIVSF